MANTHLPTHTLSHNLPHFPSQVKTDRGETLRVYEYDRYNGTVWQVDMHVANGSFFAHPKITNPTDVDLRGYWWTCVAVPATPATRILTPAKHVAETSRGGGALGNIPITHASRPPPPPPMIYFQFIPIYSHFPFSRFSLTAPRPRWHNHNTQQHTTHNNTNRHPGRSLACIRRRDRKRHFCWLCAKRQLYEGHVLHG